jgi:hypothetical protein
MSCRSKSDKGQIGRKAERAEEAEKQIFLYIAGSIGEGKLG